MRADIRLFQLGLTDSREKARALIMAGKVSLNGKPIPKPGSDIPDDALPEIAVNTLPYVSRGGLKLKKAIDAFSLDLRGVIAVDVGASTGGFTDCMLQEGAAKVYAVDVGYAQLDWRLRNDGRVVVLERRNARFMEPGWFSEQPGFATIDVAFISIKLILPALINCLTDTAKIVALIKPQFEAGRSDVKKGVIRDSKVHEAVCMDVLQHAGALGLSLLNFTYSPITGPKGNMEFLALLQASPEGAATHAIDPEMVRNTVRLAHENLSS